MENQNQYDTFDIFIFLWKKRLPIIIITLLGAIISVIVSLMIDNQYKSSTVLLPTTFVSPATGILRVSANQETDPLIIGDEDDLERMIQILKSDFIRDKIISKFDLINHYKINKEDLHIHFKANEAYNGNVTFKKTNYSGVVISVIDKDPQLASDISNEIAVLFDSLVTEMQEQRMKEAYSIAKEAYLAESDYIKVLEDSLDIYRQYGILHLYKEIDRYSEAYGKSVGNNKLTANAKKIFEKKFLLFKRYGKPVESLWLYIEELKENLAKLHLNLVQTEQTLKQPITHKFTISKAQPSDKKDSPKRMFIVVFSTFGAFMFSVAMILFLDFFKELRNRIKEDK